MEHFISLFFDVLNHLFLNEDQSAQFRESPQNAFKSKFSESFFFLNRQLIPSRMEYSFQTKPAAVKRSIGQTFLLQNRKPENIRRILNFLNQETNQQSARHFLS